MKQWYQTHLRFEMDPYGAKFEWHQEGSPSKDGYTLWSPFPDNTNYFEPSSKDFMINYRVRNMDRMLAQLRAQGVSAEAKVVDDFNGRFAWVMDPEGNKIELWEPKTGY